MGRCRSVGKDDYRVEGVMYLPNTARFASLLEQLVAVKRTQLP